jgi:opacity protein-like surface antigen
MKYFSFIVLFSVLSLNAQDLDTKNETKFGAKTSLNLANIVGEDAGDANVFVGFSVGLFAEFGLTDKLSIQPEILYSTQGSKSEGPFYYEGSVYNVKATLKTNYINVPVMFKYQVANKFTLEAGPYVGFLVSAKVKAEISGLGSDTQDAKELFKSTDFGLGLGMNYDFTDVIFANLRYSAGLVQIGDADGGGNDIKNSNLQFGLGFRF